MTWPIPLTAPATPCAAWLSAGRQLTAVSRLGGDARTRTYLQRRTAEGLSTKQIIRCLKRYSRLTAMGASHGSA
jgi:hypothetical protein